MSLHFDLSAPFLRLSGCYVISQLLIGMQGRSQCSSAALIIINHDNTTGFTLLLKSYGGFSISENVPLFPNSRGQLHG
jgi:hypothetical protein